MGQILKVFLAALFLSCFETGATQGADVTPLEVVPMTDCHAHVAMIVDGSFAPHMYDRQQMLIDCFKGELRRTVKSSQRAVDRSATRTAEIPLNQISIEEQPEASR
jgi:hypothetical protein